MKIPRSKWLEEELTVKFTFTNFPGGYVETECLIFTSSEKVYGIARCVPPDQFVRETGRKLAFGRALQKLFPTEFNYEKRAAAWKEYWKQCPLREWKKARKKDRDSYEEI